MLEANLLQYKWWCKMMKVRPSDSMIIMPCYYDTLMFNSVVYAYPNGSIAGHQEWGTYDANGVH